MMPGKNNIPSMGGGKIADALFASAVFAGDDYIVEVGAWLGAGTVSLARGARHEGQVHVFDRWQATTTEVDKLSAVGVNVERGEDLLPHFRDCLGEDALRFVVPHKGLIQQAEWPGAPIGLYVDDASKQPAVWHHVTQVFFPHIRRGAHLVLMDYYWPGAKVQREWAEANRNSYEFVCAFGAATHTAVFRKC